MKAAENRSPARGWILYDGECPFCRNLAARFGLTFESRGFACTLLQTPWIAEAINLKAGERPSEVRVRTRDFREFGGAEAIVFLAGLVWWGKPLGWFAKLPGANIILRKVYREIAAHRGCDDGACQLRRLQT